MLVTLKMGTIFYDPRNDRLMAWDGNAWIELRPAIVEDPDSDVEFQLVEDEEESLVQSGIFDLDEVIDRQVFEEWDGYDRLGEWSTIGSTSLEQEVSVVGQAGRGSHLQGSRRWKDF